MSIDVILIAIKTCYHFHFYTTSQQQRYFIHHCHHFGHLQPPPSRSWRGSWRSWTRTAPAPWTSTSSARWWWPSPSKYPQQQIEFSSENKSFSHSKNKSNSSRVSFDIVSTALIYLLTIILTICNKYTSEELRKNSLYFTLACSARFTSTNSCTALLHSTRVQCSEVHCSEVQCSALLSTALHYSKLRLTSVYIKICFSLCLFLSWAAIKVDNCR